MSEVFIRLRKILLSNDWVALNALISHRMQAKMGQQHANEMQVLIRVNAFEETISDNITYASQNTQQYKYIVL